MVSGERAKSKFDSVLVHVRSRSIKVIVRMGCTSSKGVRGRYRGTLRRVASIECARSLRRRKVRGVVGCKITYCGGGYGIVVGVRR